jgi:hypothetical protein
MVSFVLVIMGCSSDISSSRINPPNWIIGNWSESSGTMNFEFTSNDFIQSTSGISVDYKVALESDSTSTYSESSSATTYTIHMGDSTGSGTYYFTKATDSSLNCTISYSGYSVGPIVFTKD